MLGLFTCLLSAYVYSGGLNQRTDALERELHDVKRTDAELQQVNDILNSKVDRLIHRLHELNNHLTSMTSVQDHLQARIEELEARVDASDAERKTLHNTIAALTREPQTNSSAEQIGLALPTVLRSDGHDTVGVVFLFGIAIAAIAAIYCNRTTLWKHLRTHLARHIDTHP